jgi:Ca2+-binding EF-hand superfamily protein
MVLEETEDKKDLISELQGKIQRRINGLITDQKEVLNALFREIDVDGSGSINKYEFRNMLRALHLHYR